MLPHDRLYRAVADEHDALVIHMTLTSAGCPLTDVLEEQTAEALELSRSLIRPGANGAEIHKAVCAFYEERGHPTGLSKQEGEVLRDGFYHADPHPGNVFVLPDGPLTHEGLAAWAALAPSSTRIRTLLGSYQTAAASVSEPDPRVLYASLAASLGQQIGALSALSGAAVTEPFPVALDLETASAALEAYLG
mgnify:CR=1 FL=1